MNTIKVTIKVTAVVDGEEILYQVHPTLPGDYGYVRVESEDHNCQWCMVQVFGKKGGAVMCKATPPALKQIIRNLNRGSKVSFI